MADSRKQVPKGVREAVLKEYNHLCAICGKPNPQLHHIDEDPSNNGPENLLPLCANHHLSDQHNPTRKIEPGLLRLFRRFKDPAILSSQFEPVFDRLRFLVELNGTKMGRDQLRARVGELVAFVRVLEMGDFYGDRIEELAGAPAAPRVTYADTPVEALQRWSEEDRAAHLDKLEKNREQVLKLVVEQLRYQDWSLPEGI